MSTPTPNTMAESPELEFRGFPKVARLENLTMCITEKLDGTNACVRIDEHGRVSAQSRKRIITPDNDNYGFAGWVSRNSEDLLELGEGYHFGEWWGLGIQRNYGLREKRFSLFNVGRWTEENAPACCYVVPILWQGPFGPAMIRMVADDLQLFGSQAAIGYQSPEGVMVYIPQMNTYIKHPYDPNPKGSDVAASVA